MSRTQPRRLSVVLALFAAFSLFAAACGSSAVVNEAQDTVDVVEADGDVVESDVLEEDTTATQSQDEDAVDGDAVDGDAVEDDPIDPDAGGEDELAIVTSELEAVLLDWQSRGGMPAVSLSVRLPGRDPINIANGVTDLSTNTPVTTDDFFRIGSITKPMTAALVLQLVDEGLIELDEPVQTYIPTWLAGHPFESEITIRQLMNHTNGLVEYALDPNFFIDAGARLDQPFAPEEITAWLSEQEPLFGPGEQYSYETGGFLSLGSVIEVVTGNSAADEMRARIFEPSGAENIYLTPQEFPPAEVVNGYGRAEMYIAGTALLGRVDELGLTINDEPVVDFMTLPQEATTSAGWTGGGNEAQLESVSAIMKALFDGTILTDAQIAEMTEPTLDQTYGLGIDARDVGGVRVISHGGGVPGFRSYGAYLPEHDVSWAMSTNLIPLPEGASLNDLVAEMTPLLVEAAS